MALSKHYPDIAFSGNKVQPQEIDRYEVYSVNLPFSTGGSIAQWFGTAVGTSLQTPTYGVINKIADYPRSLRMTITCAAGSTKGGTAVVTGKDQFGKTQTETLGFAVAANGGTAIGTKVFAEVSSASIAIGTSNAGNGTVCISSGVAGTTALFGLPIRLGGTTDVRLLTWKSNGTTVSVNGGTIAGFVDTETSSIKAVKDVDGTTAFQAWIRSSADNSGSASDICNY